MFNSKLLNYSSTYSFIDVYLIHFSFLIWLFYIIFNNLLNHFFISLVIYLLKINSFLFSDSDFVDFHAEYGAHSRKGKIQFTFNI